MFLIAFAAEVTAAVNLCCSGRGETAGRSCSMPGGRATFCVRACCGVWRRGERVLGVVVPSWVLAALPCCCWRAFCLRRRNCACCCCWLKWRWSGVIFPAEGGGGGGKEGEKTRIVEDESKHKHKHRRDKTHNTEWSQSTRQTRDRRKGFSSCRVYYNIICHQL